MGTVSYEKTVVSPTVQKAALLQVFPSWSDEAIACLGAMWHLETGGGASEFNYNPAGVTGSYKGMSVTPPGMSLTFRAYPSVLDGVIDWVGVLGSGGYPDALQAAANGDINGFARAVCVSATHCKYSDGTTSSYVKGLQSRYQTWLATTPVGFVALQLGPVAVPKKVVAVGAVAALIAAGWYLFK
jgi:hypothetical protein